jgi:hypothetical protein
MRMPFGGVAVRVPFGGRGGDGSGGGYSRNSNVIHHPLGICWQPSAEIGANDDSLQFFRYAADVLFRQQKH